MIVAVPEILVAFVAAFMIMAGIGALYIGHMIRRSEIGFRKTDGWFFDKDLYGVGVVYRSFPPPNGGVTPLNGPKYMLF